jgi:phosphatidate cytidylyltransferase
MMSGGMDLRRRRNGSNSNSEKDERQESPTPTQGNSNSNAGVAMDRTPLRPHTSSSSASCSNSNSNSASALTTPPTPPTPFNDYRSDNRNQNENHNAEFGTPPRPLAMTAQAAVHKDESRRRKITVRVVFGFGLFGIFSGSVYAGHLYICLLVALIELLLFRELVRVRYSAYFDTIQDAIPLFRTTQWLWFAVSIFYTYGDFALEIIQRNSQLHYLLPYAQYSSSIAFILYSGTFVVTITTLQREHIKFQMNQMSWTVVVLCLTVGQLKYVSGYHTHTHTKPCTFLIYCLNAVLSNHMLYHSSSSSSSSSCNGSFSQLMHNIFNGMIWYVLPCCLVFCNDIMAYVCGMLYGRKFIQRPFLRISPNKTWEGFIGGWFFTMIAAWYLARFLAQYTWMTCPTNEFALFPDRLHCQLDPIFEPAQSFFPSQIFELMPLHVVKMIPRVVQVCSRKKDDSGALTACVSGDESQVHHHFELTIKNYYPIQVHAVWLAMFASLVAPFGGFLASGIKRAYGVKDFDSIIPGHGGVMDRMDW